ncbi:hypothetical protein N9315_02615 [Alphaproteobacteria bacterium]|nr:hypothetical protein [Alphaproteobacteria bacterium]
MIFGLRSSISFLIPVIFFDNDANILRGSWFILPTNKIPTSQMPHADIHLLIKACIFTGTNVIYMCLRQPMQMLFSDGVLFLVEQILRLNISRVFGKN